jgi:hypothetical protein
MIEEGCDVVASEDNVTDWECADVCLIYTTVATIQTCAALSEGDNHGRERL